MASAPKHTRRHPFSGEEERLRLAWDERPKEYLDSYLVEGVEDPRINLQSILTRALIADTLVPNRFDALIGAELRFGLCLTWLVRQLEAGRNSWDILDHLEQRDQANCPSFLIETYETLQHDDCPIPDYISQALADFRAHESVLGAPEFSTFERIWKGALAECPEAALSVLEPGCGSANDYRFMVSYGFGRLLRYTGLDISAKNVANARKRFPATPFVQGSVLGIPAGAGAYEHVFAFDLFEHLSPAAFEKAVGEVLRVARKEAWLSFFNMSGIRDHEFHDIGKYHLNRLSIERTVELCLQHAANVEVVEISKLVNQKFGYAGYYNPNATTLIVTI